MKPIQLNERIATIDIVRGFALIGIIFVNIPALISMLQPNTVAQHHYYYFLQIFVESKFFTIFSFLFGVGFYIFIDRAMKKGHNGYILFAKRLAILLVFGLIHMQFQPGEALTIYAICGFILLFAFKLPKYVNLILGLILLSILTFATVKLLMPLALILLGIAAGQFNLFGTVRQHISKWILFTVLMGIISAAFVWYQYNHLPSLYYFNDVSANGEAEIQKYIQLLNVAMWSAPFMSAFYVGVILLLNETPLFQKLFKPLQYFGRMALTNYLLQTVLILVAGKLIWRNHAITYPQSGLTALVINIVLIVFSCIWLSKFKFGPMEKLWRLGTYYKVK